MTTMTKNNSPIRRVQARAVDLVQSPLGVGGATFAGISLIDLIAHLGPNGLLVASLAGIVTYSFKDEIFMGLSKATGHTFSSDAASRDREQKQQDEDEDEDEDAKPPPKVYRYEEIKHLIPANRMLLGVHPESGKLELTKWIKLKCLWIVGTSSTGKSNTAYGKAHQAVEAGALLLVVDQHINKKDSLGKKLTAFKESFLRPIAVTDEEVLATLDYYENEFNRRVAGGKWSRKIVLICDEMNRMARNDRLLKRLKEIVAICGEESRGFGMYGWFLSQKAVHLKWLRDSAITVIVHGMTRIEEARLACNDDLKVARRTLKFPVGRTWIYGVDFEEMELQQEWYEIEEEQDDDDEDDETWDEDIEIELEDDDDPLNDFHPGQREVVDEEDVAALRRLPYEEYLKSRHWQRQRKGALERARGHCQMCRAEGVKLEVHHNTYERIGQELPDDLFVLCEICHGLFSKHGRLAKKSSYPVEAEAKDQLELQLVPNLPDTGRKAEDIDLSAAIAVYNTGATSRYQLAKIFGLSENQGRKLKEMIEAKAKQNNG